MGSWVGLLVGPFVELPVVGVVGGDAVGVIGVVGVGNCEGFPGLGVGEEDGVAVEGGDVAVGLGVEVKVGVIVEYGVGVGI